MTQTPTPQARQPLTDDDAHYTLTQVNEDYVPELLHCVRVFTTHARPTHAQMLALYRDGMDLEIHTASGVARQFVEFAAAGEPHVAVWATVRAAMERLGISPEAEARQWQVRDIQPFGAFLRLTLQTDAAVEWAPGHACHFVLPDEPITGNGPVRRSYTLRRVAGQTATVDVYRHGDSPGNRWATSLRAGHAVTVMGNRAEKFPDFGAGPALLLGDETALPTLAGLLERWSGGKVTVLVESHQDPASYLPLPAGATLRWEPTGPRPGEGLRRGVEAHEGPLGAVWGAGEMETVKALRAALRTQHGLTAAQCRMIAYWLQDRV